MGLDRVLHTIQVHSEFHSFYYDLFQRATEEFAFRGGRGGGTLGHYGSDSRMHFQETFVHQLAYGSMCSVWIHPEFGAQSPHGRKYIPGLQLPGDNGFRGCIHNLFTERDAGLEGSLKRYHWCTTTDNTPASIRVKT